MLCSYFRSCGLVVLAAFLACSAHGQQNNATIVGRVTDASGAVTPQAQITAKHLATNLVRTTTSGADGSYVIPSVPIGAYELKAELAAFKTEIRTGVALQAGETARLDFVLMPSALAESI